MIIEFEKLAIPTPDIAMALNDWANDPALAHLMRPSRDKEELKQKVSVTTQTLLDRLERGYQIYLIYADGKLVGEMNYTVNPPQLLKKERGSAWLGIGIGEASARGKGVGVQAMQYLESEIRAQGLARMELGVFEYNERAIKLYKKMGFKEIGRIEGFTYWQGRMWTDIRMEKRM